jgi:ATP-dependent DNA helicase RecG
MDVLHSGGGDCGGWNGRSASMKQLLFISSVQSEFRSERAGLRDRVLSDPLLRRYFDVFLFEDLPAKDQRPDQTYLAKVDQCAVFVILLGKNYGSEDADGVSPTEHEFNRATLGGKYRVMLLHDAPDRHRKTAALVDKASGQLIRRTFSSIADLLADVYASLVEYNSSSVERNSPSRFGEIG